MAIILLMALPVGAFCREQVFRSDADGCGTLLRIEGDRYVLETWRMDGERTKTTGAVIQDERSVTLRSEGQRELKRYMKKTVDGVLYLVAPGRERDLEDAAKERDRYIRTTSLGAFWREMPYSESQTQANKLPDTTRGK